MRELRFSSSLERVVFFNRIEVFFFFRDLGFAFLERVAIIFS